MKPLHVFAFALLVVPFVHACKGSAVESTAAAAPEAPIAVGTVPARSVERQLTLDLDGTLEPKRRALISPMVTGHVAEVRVERGATVAEGAPLVVLRAIDYRLAARAASARAAAQLDQLGYADAPESFDPESVSTVAAARADWEAKHDQLARLESLAPSGAVDAQTLEQARAADAAARARYDSARSNANASLAGYAALAAEAAQRRDDARNTTVRAPFAGAVVERRVEVGEYVGPQTPVVELVDATELRLELDVPERFAANIRADQLVSIRVDGTEQEIEGRVRFVSAAIDATRRTLRIEVVAENADLSVRAGHFARARVALDGTRRLVELPATALRERAGVHRVFVVENGVVEARIVQVVERGEGKALVEGALADGAAIVADPPRNIADGARVAVRGGN